MKPVIATASMMKGKTVKRARVLELIAISAVLFLVASALVVEPASAQVLAKDQQFYVVLAHGDDETAGWSYLEQLPKTTYTTFVLVTRGEGTNSCVTPEEAKSQAGTDLLAPSNIGTFGSQFELPTGTLEVSSGPYKYEGRDSPVGEPDKGERHPLGYPWVGQGSDACGDARIASWHWFLDEQFRIDGIGTDLAVAGDPEDDDDYKGTFCPSGHQGRGRGQPLDKQIGCARVWSDELGARVVYDLGDSRFMDGTYYPSVFTADQVTAALQATRENRAKWGIPTLPETGVLTPNIYGDGTSCKKSHSFDHDVVNQAIRHQDQGLPLRAGRMACAKDALGAGATVRHLVENPASLVARNLIDPVTGTRFGPALVNYGWLISDYMFFGCLENCIYWEVRT